MKPAQVIIAALLIAVALSGCAGGGGSGPHGTEGPTGQLQAGKGAISGLLVDDAFRPLHLVDGDPEVEYQVRGFILVQETGQQVRSNPDGEFRILNLEPGRYTLRTTASGHEATPYTVNVEAGVFTETTVIARRVISADGLIVTQEFSVFKACEVTLIVIGYPVPCTLDASGDTDRDTFVSDYSMFSNATWMVTEFRASQVGNYEIRVGQPNNVGSCGGNYAIKEIVGGDYIKFDIQKNATEETENMYGCADLVWTNEGPVRTILYIDGEFKHDPVVGGFGAGVFIAIEGKFVQSVFIGEPEVDLESYCTLCQ